MTEPSSGRSDPPRDLRRQIQPPWYSALDNRALRFLLYRVIRGSRVRFTHLPSYIGEVRAGQGSFSVGEVDVRATNATRISIGNYSGLGRNCKILAVEGHYPHHLSLYPFPFLFPAGDEYKLYVDRGPVTIGHDVMIAEDVTIFGGVTIGNGALVGTKSLVTQDVPPYAIYAGVPARQIGLRFPPDVAKKVEASRWWDLAPRTLSQNMDIFLEPDVERALNRVEEIRRGLGRGRV